eukprot:1981442-Prymnesium_polylepis.1
MRAGGRQTLRPVHARQPPPPCCRFHAIGALNIGRRRSAYTWCRYPIRPGFAECGSHWRCKLRLIHLQARRDE